VYRGAERQGHEGVHAVGAHKERIVRHPRLRHLRIVAGWASGARLCRSPRHRDHPSDDDAAGDAIDLGASLFGALAYAVSRRSHAIGIRMALGQRRF
jgi:hypothetical protein